jgi:hypothetical protein
MGSFQSFRIVRGSTSIISLSDVGYRPNFYPETPDPRHTAAPEDELLLAFPLGLLHASGARRR